MRRAIGVALQDAAIDPLMTGRELVRLQAVLHGIARSDADRRGDVLLERVGLTGAANRRVGTYSGGMRRRLDLALSLVHEPSVLFLDEPTTGLDPTSRTALWEEVRRLNAEGTTVFLTTQYLEEADELAGRVAIIDNGRIVREGQPEALKAADRRRHARRDRRRRPRGASRRGAARGSASDRAAKTGSVAIGIEGGAAALSGALRALEEAGIAVEHVELDAPSLDDVFADATGRRLEGAGRATRGARGGRVTDRRRRRPRTARSASARARRWRRPPGSPGGRSGAPSGSPPCGCPACCSRCSSRR